MPTIPKGNILCRYSYDPLDRQAACRMVSHPDTLLFYDKSRLTTEIQGALQTSVFRHDDQLLAQQRRQDSKADTLLLVTDQQQSVLGGADYLFLSRTHLTVIAQQKTACSVCLGLTANGRTR